MSTLINQPTLFWNYKTDRNDDKTNSTGNSIAVRPEKVLKLYKTKLTQYEQKEILNYPEIYFIGGLMKPFNNSEYNDGFDDPNGSYIFEPHDHIAYRFEILKCLGRGAFGQVFKVHDHKKDIKLALKMIRNDAKKKFHKAALVEIKILECLKSVDKKDQFNFVHMFSNFTFRNHICITFELLSINLLYLLQETKGTGFSHELIRRFTYSLVKSLCLLNELKIIHADLKPENVVLKSKGKCDIKLIDFGSSCFDGQTFYGYIQSRYYRSPEVILNIKYGMPIDIWSLGCLCFELASNKILFEGRNKYDQLFAIQECLGDVPGKMLYNKIWLNNFLKYGYCSIESNKIKISPNYKDRFNIVRLESGQKQIEFEYKDLENKELFKDFILKCLVLDPDQRMKPKQALNHPYLKLKKIKTKYVLNKIETLKRTYFLNNENVTLNDSIKKED